jgi:hypothetical protein
MGYFIFSAALREKDSRNGGLMLGKERFRKRVSASYVRIKMDRS